MAHPLPADLSEDAPLRLYPLTFVDEGDQVVIGRPEIDSFAVFPADAAAVVRHLQAGEDVASVAGWYQAEYGEPVDIADFVETLRSLDFLRPQNEAASEPSTPMPIRWRRLGGVLLSPLALGLYALAAGVAVYLMVTVPVLRPEPSKVFFTRSLLVVLGVTVVAQVIGVAWHEWFHVLAGRRLGLPSRLSLGRRLYFLVFQTTLVGLMGLPARKRILPFCAGLIADAVLVSLLTGLAEVGRLASWPTWIWRVAIAVTYLTLLRMLWQAMIFMETDLCHVLAVITRCTDLHRLTRIYLRSQLGRLRGQSGVAAAVSGWRAHELRTVRWYAPFVVAGSLAIIFLAAAGVVPVMAELALRTYHGLVAGGVTSRRFWDSLLTAAAVISQFAVVAIVALHERKRRPLPAESS